MEKISTPKYIYSQLLAFSSPALGLWIVLAITPVEAGQFRVQSGDKQVQLIELYTSEGCSSCPPADKYISQLLADSNLWLTRIPLAFHVDYWNYIGWIDPFAKAEHSARQRLHSRYGNVRSVYTPSFVVDGSEWTGFFNGSPWPVAKPDNPGNLQLVYDGSNVDVTFSPAASVAGITSAMTLRIAWLGAGLESMVKNGENRGKKLRHNFVVLRSKTDQLTVAQGFHTRLSFTSSNLPYAEKYALVAWLEDKRTHKPVQAAGGWVELAGWAE